MAASKAIRFILAWILSITLVVGFMPITAFADNPAGTQASEQTDPSSDGTDGDSQGDQQDGAGASGQSTNPDGDTQGGSDQGGNGQSGGQPSDQNGQATDGQGDTLTNPDGTPVATDDVAGPQDPTDPTADPTDPEAEEPAPVAVTYRAHQQRKGWMDWVESGTAAGYTGQSLRLEAFQAKIINTELEGSIEYRAHVQNKGWMGWVADGAAAGTTGQSLRMEALQIRLTGELAKHYDVWYRVHAQHFGWMGWTKNGEKAGTQGCRLRVESVQIRLVEKDGEAPGSTSHPFRSLSLSYTSHVQSIGWQSWVGQGVTSGTTGKGLRMEALKVKLNNDAFGGYIYAKAYVQGSGWTDWAKEGATAGTTGKSKRIEAVKVHITGEMATRFDIWYRVAVPGMGWLGWTKNNTYAGTYGYDKPVQAIQIKLLSKGSSAPGSTKNPYVYKLDMDEQLDAIDEASGSGLKVFGGSYNLNSKAGKALKSEIDYLTDDYTLAFVMMDLNTGIGVCYSPNKYMYSASCLKGPYVAAINKYYPDEVTSSVESTMRQTITVSSNEGYSSLRNRFGTSPMSRFMSYTDTTGDWEASRKYTYVSPKDLAKLWIGNHDYFYVHTNGNSKWCRGLYTDPLNSFIARGLGDYYTTHSKPGWYPGGGYNVQNDAGIVMVDGHPYVISIMSSACGRYGALADLVEALDDVHSDMVD